jgi:glycosyltransferase involved in cell wall biosynthesis
MMGKPRIYIAIATFYPVVGGAERQALLQARSLRERGYEATIVTFRHWKTCLCQEAVEGVPIMRIAGRVLGDREKRPRVLQRLLYLLALVIMGWTLWKHRHCYDILHVYQLTLLAWPVALVCWLANRPMVIAVRSTGSSEAARSHNNASLFAGPLDTTAPWQQVDGRASICGDLERLERLGKPVVRLTYVLLQHVHAIVVVLSSRMLKDLAAHHFLLLNTQLIPNGVDIKRFHPDHAPRRNEKREQVVVCVAQLRFEKGIDVLLQAWHLLHEQAPQAQLIIVGGSLQSQLERMARALGIADSVEFAGEQKDVAAQFHRGAIAVLPSRFEGMPNALLEAMACGLACVATRVSGSEDIIQHGINGLLVESEDHQGLAQALLALLGDPALTEKYGQAARATIEQHYALEHITDTYVELYAKLVHSKSQV